MEEGAQQHLSEHRALYYSDSIVTLNYLVPIYWKRCILGPLLTAAYYISAMLIFRCKLMEIVQHFFRA